jgi:hypothetical protein
MAAFIGGPAFMPVKPLEKLWLWKVDTSLKNLVDLTKKEVAPLPEGR